MRSDIYGRGTAIETLKTVESNTESVMVGIFGRRRIGKTYLVDEYFKDEPNYFYIKNVGIKNEPLESQIRIFEADINQRIDDYNDELRAILISRKERPENFEVEKEEASSKTWEDFFRFLSKTIDRLQQSILENELDRKIVYFFDEVPYAAENSENFANRLAAIWEKGFKNKKNLIFILCGSAASWMIKEIANAKGGLNSRCKHKIHLRPFSYSEAVDYLNKKYNYTFQSEIDGVKTYMSIGGVAKYLDLYNDKKKMMFAQSITELMFSEFRDMREEFDLLMDSIFRNAEVHKDLIFYLSKKGKGASEDKIVDDLNKKGHKEDEVKRALGELVDCDYLIEMELVHNKGAGPVFRLIDEYCRFYFKWIHDQGDENFQSDSSYWNNEAHNSKIWFGTAFEIFCFRNKDTINHLLELKRFNTKFFSLSMNQTGGAECDMIIEATIAKKVHGVFIIENKFKEGEKFSINAPELITLNNKISLLKEAKKYDLDPQVVFVTSDGVIENENFKGLSASSFTIGNFRK